MKKKPAKPKTQAKSTEIDIVATLRGVQADLLLWLIDEAKHGRGISRMTAITKLREWHSELPPDLPPFEIEEAKPENEKVIKMRDAV